MRIPFAFFAAILLSTPLCRRASANGVEFEDPYDVPTAPRPPTLPELTHAELETTLETTAGALLPLPGGVLTHAYVQRLAVEMPLGPRRLYVGADYELASGSTIQSFRWLGSNLSLGARTLWATRTGLAFGGGLRLMVPTAAFDPSGTAAAAATEAAALRPWDVPFFLPYGLGARPFVDVRVIDGPFVAQFRQGLDLMASTKGGPLRFYANAALYLGWRITDAVAGGLEIFETYTIDAPGVPDNARSAIVASPNVRLALPWVQPAISVFTNIGPSLNGASTGVWGFRVACTLVLDTTSSHPRDSE